MCGSHSAHTLLGKRILNTWTDKTNAFGQVCAMEPLWLKEDKIELVEDNWAKKWAIDSARRLPLAVEIVRERQMRREASFEIMLIAVGIGILGNMFAQSLFPVLIVPLFIISSCGIGILMVAFLVLKDYFAPIIPARLWMKLDFSTLMQASDSDEWFALKYLIQGAGFTLGSFEEYAEEVLKRTVYSYGFLALRAKGLAPKILRKRSDSKFGSSFTRVIASVDLSEASSGLGFGGVRSMLELELYSSRIGADDRVHGFDLVVRIGVTNPVNPKTDDFLEEVVEPSLVGLASSYAQEAWSELHTEIYRVVELHRLLSTMNDYMKRHGVQDPWFLMDYYPYDGRSNVMFVIDKCFLDKAQLQNNMLLRIDALERLMMEHDFVGSYVTDSDQWSSPTDHEREGELYPTLPHFSEELIYVRPRFVVTIGSKAKDFAEQHRSEKRDFQIIPLLVDTQCGEDASSFEKNLQEAFKSLATAVHGRPSSKP